MPIFSDAFWQQEIPQSKFPLWFVRRPVASTCNALCGVFHLVIGIIALTVMSGTYEKAFTYSVAKGNAAFSTADGDILEITSEEGADTAYIHIELSNCFSNYRTFAMSKENALVGSTLSPYECDETSRSADILFQIRGKDFILTGNTIQDFSGLNQFSGPKDTILNDWINVDGLFEDPTDKKDEVTGANPFERNTYKGKIIRTRKKINENDADADDTPNEWAYEELTTMDRFRKINEAWKDEVIDLQLPKRLITPCGLNSFSINLDRFEVVKLREDGSEGKPVPIDETELAWNSDTKFVQDRKQIRNHPKLKNVAEIQNDTIKKDLWNVSWLRPQLGPDENFDKFGKIVEGVPYQRLLAWYRNSASSTFRLFIGKIHNLRPGKYKIKIKQAGAEWGKWGIDTRLVVSKLSAFGSKNLVIPGLCIAIAVLQLSFTVFLLVYRKKQD